MLERPKRAVGVTDAFWADLGKEGFKMGIVDRISTILKANINDLLDRAEDPAKMIDQLIRDMEQAYEEAERQVTESMALEKKLEREYLAAEALVEQAQNQATKAVMVGRDDLARNALTRKLALAKRAKALKAELEEQTEAVTSLKSQLHALRAKLDDARQQKAVLLSRQKRLEAERTIRQSMKDLSYAESAFEAFERMKERISDEEAILEAAKELEEEQQKTQLDNPEIAAQEAVEIELAALKRTVLEENQENEAE
jgi:phage shock protein A